MKRVIIIQARVGSTRLPGKVLSDLAGEPMLARVIARSRRATKIDDFVIATTTKPEDDAIVKMCTIHSWPCFRGSEDDLLDRYYKAALQHKADVVVRITSDCPLIEPQVLDLVAGEFLIGSLDYASNALPPRTFPRGLDVEVLAFEALERAWREDTNSAWREHVTPYIYRHPESFRIKAVLNDFDFSFLRWTVDTREDLELVQRIYSHFGHDEFSWRNVLELLAKHSSWLDLNRRIAQKEVA
ncbi:MAG: glycosyltransferase family protein [Deltaproteobacteria bacterium]|nr:glycosyltransferase family protein [Deltaproteobacteria bacterium]